MVRKLWHSIWLIWAALAALGCYFVVQHALPKFVVSQEVYTDYYWDRRNTLLFHVIAGLAALILGPFQFILARRRGWGWLHRWTGRTYLICTGVAALSAIALACTAPVPQPLYAIGLYGVSAFWLYSGFVGWSRIRIKRPPAHRRWMIRNYATTFFFVLFFAFFDSFMALGWPESDWANALTWAVWLGIILPLLAVEVTLRINSADSHSTSDAPLQ